MVEVKSYMYFIISLSISHFFAFSFQLVLFKLRGLGCGMHLCSMLVSIWLFLSKSFTRSSTYRPMDTITVGFSKFIDSTRYLVQISCSTFFLSASNENGQTFAHYHSKKCFQYSRRSNEIYLQLGWRDISAGWREERQRTKIVHVTVAEKTCSVVAG